MSVPLAPKINESCRLNITVYSGHYSLNLQFNCPQEERKANENGYKTLMFLMEYILRVRYDASEGTFYKVRKFNNQTGFRLVIEWEYINTKEEALKVVNYIFERVLTFDLKAEGNTDEEPSENAKINIAAAKEMAEIFKNDIFGKHSVDFYETFWDPWSRTTAECNIFSCCGA